MVPANRRPDDLIVQDERRSDGGESGPFGAEDRGSPILLPEAALCAFDEQARVSGGLRKRVEETSTLNGDVSNEAVYPRTGMSVLRSGNRWRSGARDSRP